MASVVVALALLSVVVGCRGGATPVAADLVLLNGKIITMDAEQPQVAALAAKGQTILAVETGRATRPSPRPQGAQLVIELLPPLALRATA